MTKITPVLTNMTKSTFWGKVKRAKKVTSSQIVAVTVAASTAFVERKNRQRQKCH